MQQANARAGGETLSDIADAGGKVGHTTPPTLFEPVARASLCESQEAGLIRSFQVFGVGDDLHLLMSHSQGIDANQIHLMAFQTFWRLVWVTELIGYKPYGLAQDLKIGLATKVGWMTWRSPVRVLSSCWQRICRHRSRAILTRSARPDSLAGWPRHG